MAKNHPGKKYPDGLKNLVNKKSGTKLKMQYKTDRLATYFFLAFTQVKRVYLHGMNCELEVNIEPN